MSDGIGTWKAEYRKRDGNQQVRPIHGWVEAHDWEELIPTHQAEEGLRWFILGRAFSELYPTAESAAQGAGARVAKEPRGEEAGTYVYKRGSYYYLETNKEEDPILIGASLRDAVANFVDRSDWQQIVKQRVETEIEAVGVKAIRERLENKYQGMLEDEIDTATQNKDGERLPILRKLLTALKNFIKGELQGSRV